MTATEGRQRVDLQLTINGVGHRLDVPAERLLLELLRDDLGLTGTKEGCSIGVCGACSVLVDGAVVSSCLLPAVLADGASITTIEGIAQDDQLSPLQDAFIAHGGFQCGICTPGQIVSASALLAETPQPTDPQIVDWMQGNLCRCTGYYGILRAIRAASGRPDEADAGVASADAA